jgi:hypothetical protein
MVPANPLHWDDDGPREDVWLSAEEYGRYVDLWNDAMDWQELEVQVIQARLDASRRLGFGPDIIAMLERMLAASEETYRKHVAAFEVIRESKDRP